MDRLSDDDECGTPDYENSYSNIEENNTQDDYVMNAERVEVNHGQGKNRQ